MPSRTNFKLGSLILNGQFWPVQVVPGLASTFGREKFFLSRHWHKVCCKPDSEVRIVTQTVQNWFYRDVAEWTRVKCLLNRGVRVGSIFGQIGGLRPQKCPNFDNFVWTKRRFQEILGSNNIGDFSGSWFSNDLWVQIDPKVVRLRLGIKHYMR